MALPLDIRDILNTGERVRAEREQPVRIAVMVDAEAPDELVEAFQVALRPATATARIHVELVRPGEALAPDPMADAVIGVAGPGSTLADSLKASRATLVPTVAVAVARRRDEVAERLGQPIADTLASDDPADAVHDTGAWLVDRVDNKKLALASNFAFMRRAVADESVKNTSLQNALIGGVVIIPGADMPVMTANQVKMILQIAAAYGEPLGAARAKELAAVVGGAFALRAVARNLVGLVPGFGWAIKAGIGYSGTLAMGKAAIEYFENGGTVTGVVEHIGEARAKAIQRERANEVIDADATVVSDATSAPGADAVAIEALPSVSTVPAGAEANSEL